MSSSDEITKQICQPEVIICFRLVSALHLLLVFASCLGFVVSGKPPLTCEQRYKNSSKRTKLLDLLWLN